MISCENRLNTCVIIHLLTNLPKKTLLSYFAQVCDHYTNEGLGNYTSHAIVY